jgi:hypothetical protein
MVTYSALARFSVLLLATVPMACAQQTHVRRVVTWNYPVSALDTASYRQFVRAQRDSIRAANAVADAEAAAARGDYALLGILGLGVTVPGLSCDLNQYEAKWGLRTIAGADMRPSSDRERQELKDAAVRYAREYNAVILRRLPEPCH